jgi:hypothetical protein
MKPVEKLGMIPPRPGPCVNFREAFRVNLYNSHLARRRPVEKLCPQGRQAILALLEHAHEVQEE